LNGEKKKGKRKDLHGKSSCSHISYLYCVVPENGTWRVGPVQIAVWELFWDVPLELHKAL